MSSENLPQEWDSQEIGHHAIDAFDSNRPASWRVNFLDGDKDVGIDGQVQVVKNGKYQTLFHVQIKGSRSRREDGNSAKLNASEDYYSVALESKTINYYLKIGTPIMLVFADLHPGEDARDSSVYYLWIHEAIEEVLRSQGKLSKKSHTFQVPVSQELTRDLDIIEYLASRAESSRVGRELYQSIAQHSEKPEKTASRIVERFTASKLVVDSLAEGEAENPWVDAPANTLARHLQTTMGYLESNNFHLATRELDCIEDKIAGGTNHEKADYYHQRGLVREIPGDYSGAEAFHSQAHKLMPGANKYLLALIEARIGLGIQDDAEYEKLLGSIQDKDGSRWSRLRAKIMAIQKREAEAVAELGGDESAAGLATKALVLFLSRNTKSCLVICNDAIERGIGKAHQKLIFRMTRARLGFERGFPETYSRERVPYCGRDEMDVAVMKEVWEDIEQCWQLAHELNYPREVELLVDITAFLSGFFGQEQQYYDHLKRSADCHIHRANVQEVVLQFAQFLQDDDRVRVQLGRINDESEKSYHLSMMLFRRGEKLRALKEVMILAKGLAQEGIKAYLSALEMGIICADELARHSERDALLGMIKRLPSWTAIAPVFEYFFKINVNELHKTEGLKYLYSLFAEGNQNQEICEVLFAELRLDINEHCNSLIHVSRSLRAFRALSRKETLKLCHAHASIGKWEDVLDSCRKGIRRFGIDSDFCALQAWAYDGLGDTPRALKLAERALAQEGTDPGALELYVEIAMRCGLLNRAKEAIEQLLSSTSCQRKKCRYLMTLLKIEMAIDSLSPKLWEYWKRLGPLTNRKDEVEEGTFLLLLLQVTNACSEEPSDEFKDEIRERMRAYFNRFPESKVFRQVMIPSHLEGKQLLAYLDHIAGGGREQWPEGRALANRFQHGQLAIPYCLRPFIFREIQDTFWLFWLTRSKRKGDRLSELCLGESNMSLEENETLKENPPLVDETTLLVLSELGLLEKLFDVFGKIFISRGALRRLMYYSQCHYTSLSYERARVLRDELSKFITSIHQIPDPVNGGDDILSELEHLHEKLEETGLALYCDDLTTRHLLLAERHSTHGFTTVDFIRFLGRSGELLEAEATRKLGEICEWNVSGVPVTYHEVLAVLEEEGLLSCDLMELDLNPLANGLLELAWDLRQTYKFCLQNFVGLAGFIFCAPGIGLTITERTSLVAVLWAKWASRMVGFSEGESSREAYYLRALLEISIHLARPRESQLVILESASPIWKSCQRAREMVAGNEMTLDSERAFIRSVGLEASRIHEDVRDECVSFLLSGLDEGRDREVFNEGYLKARVAHEFRDTTHLS